MTDSAFYRLGRLAGGKARKVKWMWSSLTGNETEAIAAEYGVGWDMAAVVGNGAGATPTRRCRRCSTTPVTGSRAQSGTSCTGSRWAW